MLKKIKKTSSEGFTIIEVMIVLAIAALILLIVLLAVPALQRSANNTSRKNDTSAIAAALSNYVNNNNNQLPTTVASNGNTNELEIGNGATGNTEQAKLGFYTVNASTTQGASSGDVFISAASTAVVLPKDQACGLASSSCVTINSVSIITGESCNGTTPSLNANGMTVWYATDTGSPTPALQCDDVT